MWIKITQDDINNGNAAQEACPITLALRRKFGGDISVSRDFIRVRKNRTKKFFLFKLPAHIKDYILSNKPGYQSQIDFYISPKDVRAIKALLKPIVSKKTTK